MELPFYEVELRAQGAIVRRTTRRYEDLAELAPSFQAIYDRVAVRRPSANAVLVDLRAIVGRNDAQFEAALAPLRRELLGKFARAALLVRTSIGRMQLQRYLEDDGITAEVFSDEDAAMAWFESRP